MEVTHSFMCKNNFLCKILLVENFIDSEDLEQVTGDVYSKEQSWIYKRIFNIIENLNKNNWNFRLYSFLEELHVVNQRKNEDPFTLCLGTENESLRKLVVLLPKESVHMEIITGEKISVPKGSIVIFPSYIGWRFVKSIGLKCYITFVGGDHFS